MIIQFNKRKTKAKTLKNEKFLAKRIWKNPKKNKKN